ncbi:MAG: ABC transporter permease [Syntrophobacteraceae bacterium]|nr:ABC transporter permease [Syntrophobacteraceae bacterium]
MEFVELRNVHKVYSLGETSIPVLRGVSLDVSRGEFIALMGASGSGKTTLMNILGCLDRPSSGEYWLDGCDITALSSDERALLRNEKIGFVFQNFNLLPRTSALKNVLMPLSYSSNALSEREGRQRGEDLLERLGLGSWLHHEPSQLSGGQQQRVAIARALINRPSLLFADEPTGNLDSKTSEDVLKIFQRLNEEEGVTIVLVTHDENVARHAGRVIRIRDGIIESEQMTSQAPVVRSPDVTGTIGQAGGDKRRTGKGGRVRGAFRMLPTALNGLRRNILRAALTTLGIMIGVGAVIAMMEIGRGSSTSIQQTIASMGANNLLIFPGTVATGGVTFGSGSTLTLTPEDAEAIRSEIPGVRAVAPVVRARTQLVYGNRNWVPSVIYGTTAEFLLVREWDLAEGDPFTIQDVRNGSKVCLVGQTIVRELLQGEPAMGKEIRINNVPFKVVGILNSKGANMMGMDQDDILLAPWTTIKYRVTGSSLGNTNQSASSSSSSTSTQTNTTSDLYPSSGTKLYPEQSSTQAANNPVQVRFTNVDQILVAANTAEEIPAVIQEISRLLRERHRIRAGRPDDFYIRDLSEITKAMTSTANMMTRLLLAVALISLIVGGVGIMNIMLVSVTERTREIGLRMAVGARQRSILQQFLVESVVLCFLGGAVGILLGRGISSVVTLVLKWPTRPSLDAILAAFAVSVTVGIIFGYYPAWKASRLDPIIALRYE